MRRAVIAALTTGLLVGVVGGPPSTAEGTQQRESRREQECRYKHYGTGRLWTYQKIVLTIECATAELGPIGGLSKVMSVWQCESGWAVEPWHSDSYHGPFQYLRSTFRSQQTRMPALIKQFDLPHRVHSPRANVITAIGWARWSWGPWTCA